MSADPPLDLPQNAKFAEYVSLEGHILAHEIQQISKIWDAEQTIKAEVSGDERYNDKLRKSSVMFIDQTGEFDWVYRRLGDIAGALNHQIYQFDVTGFQQELQLTRYEKGDFFDWHLDFGPGGSSTRKLSLTVQLSETDAYEGGDLQFMINSEIVSMPRKKGTIVVFPSFILHRVTEITKGSRESIVGWMAGPPYR